MSSPSQPLRSAEAAAREWRANLPAEHRIRSNLRGSALFAFSALQFVLAFLGAFLLPAPWMRLVCIFAQPLIIGGLFVIAHDATHGSLVRTGWLNRLLARLSLLPSWHPYTSWAHAHNTLHHGGTNLKGRHPDFAPLSLAEYNRLPWWRRLLERLYRSPVGPGPGYVLDFYLNCIVLPRGAKYPPYRLAFHLDRLLVAAFVAVQLLAGWALATKTPGALAPPYLQALVAVVVPWLVWAWFQGFVSFIQHTHPRIAWYDKEEEWSFYHVQLRSTTHVVFPWRIERLLHNIMDHPAHHIDPTIPLYRLPGSQRLLEQSTPEHSVVVRWSLREYFRTCAKCKLYDYDNHCWLNFRGEPTTPPGLCGDLRRGRKGEDGHDSRRENAAGSVSAEAGQGGADRPAADAAPLQPLR
jgi:omega-6 fatty acid desaturase (delta-12 desaturase)